MKQCKFCHWLVSGRRWLLLAPTMMFTLVTPLFAPLWIYLLLLSAHLVCFAMCAIYMRDMRYFVTPQHLRLPGPRDASPEILMVDAALVDNGPVMLGVAQPYTPVQQMQPSRGEGARLLASAICLLHTELPYDDAQALLSACRTQMNLTPSDLLPLNPVIHHGTEAGMTSITVQEEDAERTYFVGKAATVLRACSAVMDGEERLLSEEGRALIRESALRMSSAGERLFAFATALGDATPTFLGMAAVADDLDLTATEQLRKLRKDGMTLILRDDHTRSMDVPVLRRNLDIPDLHTRPDVHLCITNPYPDKRTLSIVRHGERDIIKPLEDLKNHFTTMSFMLRRLWGVMALCLLCCVLMGGLHSPMAVSAILTAGYLSFGSLYAARKVRLYEQLLTGIACLLLRLLLNAVAPAAQDLTGTLLCITMAAIIVFTLRDPKKPLSAQTLLPLAGVVVFFLVVQVVTSWHVLAMAALPALLGVVSGALIGCCFLFTGRKVHK